MAQIENRETPTKPPVLGILLDRTFHFLSSLKVATVIIFLLAVALTVATVLESRYDTPTGQYYVYKRGWFFALLGAFGVNIFAVMVDRWPWKKKHGPFLLAHIGILVLLFGSWLTFQKGLDGNMRVSEGQIANTVELTDHYLYLSNGSEMERFSVPWIPPLEEFKPISFPEKFPIRIEKYITHAEPEFSFVPAEAELKPGESALPAALIKIQGGPMRVEQEFWLWAGDRSFSQIQMGPAEFGIGPEPLSPRGDRGGPQLSFVYERSPELVRKEVPLRWVSRSSDGKLKTEKLTEAQLKPFSALSQEKNRQIPRENMNWGVQLDLGWKGGVTATLLDWIPHAQPLTVYKKSRQQYGPAAPPPALLIVAGQSGSQSELWLGLGDRAQLKTAQATYLLSFMPDRVRTPFSVMLDRFSIERYQGSMTPASFRSQVRVGKTAEEIEKAKSVEIKMNEPLRFEGFTLYQASYEDALPRPTVSIFSVNQDPGRPWKYWGSLFLVLGSIWLFAVKVKSSRKQKEAQKKIHASKSETKSEEIIL